MKILNAREYSEYCVAVPPVEGMVPAQGVNNTINMGGIK
jgi:hypothetical protein